MKCQVRLCPNDSTQGRFDGNLCAPCARVLKGEAHDWSAAARRIVASAILPGSALPTIPPGH